MISPRYLFLAVFVFLIVSNDATYPTGVRRRCGRRLAVHLFNLCGGMCYGKVHPYLGQAACAVGMSDEQLINSCCAEGPRTAGFDLVASATKEDGTPKYQRLAFPEKTISCGRALVSRVRHLCPNKCTTDNAFAETACSTGLTDDELVGLCCPGN